MAEASAEQLAKVLEYHYGYRSFREHQLQAIQATLRRKDLLAILPTGAGKSLCFQLPALARDSGFTVVIGPLMALARDQVNRCQEQDIEAELFNSEVSDDKRRSIISDILSDSPSLKLLYATPESLRNPTLREALQECERQETLVSFAVDEAHCVSEWGIAFRPAYLELASLRSDFPTVPIAGFTASCTKDVQQSITSVLNMRDPLILKSSVNRPNIEYQVVYKDLIGDGSEEAAVQHLVEFLTARKGQTGIIYARLRKTCDWLASVLSGHELDVAVYHAGKDATARRKVQGEWSEGAMDVVVATIAFGMGIDKADVRWVIHWNASSSMEAMYQESGRVGRDGLPSLSLVYCSRADLEAAAKLEKGSRRGSMRDVAGLLLEAGCRRRKIATFFGESRGPCQQPGEQQCDFCACPTAVRQHLRQLDDPQRARARAEQLAAAREGAEDGEEAGQGGEGSTAAVGPAGQRQRAQHGLRPPGLGWGAASALKERGNVQQAGQGAGHAPALKARRRAAALLVEEAPLAAAVPSAAAAATSRSPVAMAAAAVDCRAGAAAAAAAAPASQSGGTGAAAAQRAAAGLRRAFVPPKRQVQP